MDKVFVLETENDNLTFDAESGRLISLRGMAAPDQEFLASVPEHPVFIIEYLDADREYWQVDSRSAALVTLDGVAVGRDDLVGAEGGGAALLERVVDRATVGLCAEMLGSMSEAFDRTIQYLKDRKQFGVPIGSFQALKHRAAEMYIQIELSRSAVMAAVRAADAGAPDAPLLISLAKARCSDAGILVANEAIQMFGGIGMTDEEEIGFFLKRARVSEMMFGDAAWHRDRWARLGGY